MAPEYAGRGDAVRSMELLWGRTAKGGARGPKQGTDLESVVRAAIEIADADGLDAVSMRRVAERLGLGTMSLYTYVPGKGELLDLMLDTVYGELSPDIGRSAPSSREALEALARDQWDFHHRHPWTLYVASSRAVLGPNESDSYEAALSVVADIGVPARDAVAIVDSLSMYVRGAAREAVEAAAAEGVTGMSELEWWTARDEILTEKMTDDRFPTLGRLEAEGAFAVPPDAENYNLRFIVDDFEFGLQRLLDGFDAHVRAAPSTRRRPKQG
jgi:AcrR family transcriptional regulator